MSAAVDTATEVPSFRIEIPEEQIDDLRRRIAATRWPCTELVADRRVALEVTRANDQARR